MQNKRKEESNARRVLNKPLFIHFSVGGAVACERERESEEEVIRASPHCLPREGERQREEKGRAPEHGKLSPALAECSGRSSIS